MLMNFLVEGGYAKVYVNEGNTEVKKVLPKYVYTKEDPRRFINYNAILDLTIQRSFGGKIPGLPVISSYKVDEENITFFMPFYGTPLNKTEIPQDMIPYVVSQLLETLLHLAANGIQHTDIKPCNILIEPDTYKVTLIDYNMVSLKVNANGNGKWSPSYGTWNYCAPEIIWNSKPQDTSPVWSVGLLIAFMYARFPVREIYQVDADKLQKRQFWKNLMTSYSEKCKGGFPLSTRHLAMMPQTMIDIYRSCMKWSPDDRISLHDLYGLMDEPGATLREVAPRPIPSTLLHRDVATVVVNKQFNVCRVTRSLYAFQRAAEICLASYRPQSVSTLFEHGCAAHYLALLMYGNYITDDITIVQNTLTYWQLQDTEAADRVEAAIWTILDTLNWDVWLSTPIIEGARDYSTIKGEIISRQFKDIIPIS